MTYLSTPASSRHMVALLLVLLCFGVGVLNERASEEWASADKACTTRDIAAKVVAMGFVCVDKDGRLFEVPTKAD